MASLNSEMVVSLDTSGIADALDAALGLGLEAEQRWFRADVSRGIELKEGKPSVDRENGVIYGYSVITKGPALGHGMEIDEKTLGQVVQLGNQAKMGIKARFDHPNASNTSMGTFLGRTKNFRKAGDRVIGDLYLSESAKEAPQGDLYTYVLGLAERDPQAFGASIVFEGKSEFQIEEDGTRKKDAQGKPLPALARVEKLLASDIVDEPAANAGGLFSQEQSLASKITVFLNRWAQHDLLPQLSAVLATTTKGDHMSEQVGHTAEQLAAAKSEGLQAGIHAERERVAGIQKSFSAVWGEQPPASECKIRDGFIELGTGVEDATRMFKERKLTVLTDAAPQSAGGGSETVQTTVDLSKLPLEDRFKAEWDKSPNLRAEFGSLSVYLAFQKASDNGQVKILKK